MGHDNGFFGSLQGPFKGYKYEKNEQTGEETVVQQAEQLIDKIRQQCLDDSFHYISKLGIYSVRNFDLDITGTYYPQTIVIIKESTNPNKNIEFILGKTGMLQLEDCKIVSIKFKEDTDDKVYIDYQYE